MKNFEKARVA